jgi:hypothetical protein
MSDMQAVIYLFIIYLVLAAPAQREAQFCALANQRRSTSVCACQTAGNIICQPLLKGIAFRQSLVIVMTLICN